MYRFLLSPRWIGLALFVVLMSGLFVRLGMWQHDRYEQRQSENATIRGNYTAEPLPVERIDEFDEDLVWRTVTATGTFDPDVQVVVRFRPRDGRTGVEVVSPLRLDSGRILLVNRGWLAADNSSAAPQDLPPPPRGPVTVVGWWQPDSEAGADTTTPRDGQVRAIDSRRWSDLVGPTVPGHLALTSPEQDGLEPAQEPDLGSGPSLFYSIQWYFFAGLALLGYVWFVRDEVKNGRSAATTSS